jgi:hypothetical protein
MSDEAGSRTMVNPRLVSAPSSSISQRPKHSVRADADMLLADYGIAHTTLAMGLNESILECCFGFQRKIHQFPARRVGAVLSSTTFPMKQTQPVLALAFLPSNRLLFRM